MKLSFFAFVLFFAVTVTAFSQEQTAAEFQEELNEFYKDPETSPLLSKDLKKFKGHPFFSISDKYRVTAQFERAVGAVPFAMKTTTDRLPTYELYGIATFTIDGISYQLNLYQSHGLRETDEYADYLFLPFTDLTNGNESYGGGRFIDLEIPEGDQIVIDFNQAYNPYCAYNHRYSCPIPPKENDLAVRIEAGVKKPPFGKH